MEKLSAWIREQAREVLAAEVSEKTRAQYERNGARLDADRVVGCPVDLGPYEGVGQLIMRIALPCVGTPLVAACRLCAITIMHETAGGNSSPESDAAWQRVLYAASDLVAYPKDSRPGSPSDLMTRLGLADAKPEGAPSRAKREGALLLRRERLRNCALLIALRKNIRTGESWCGLAWSPLAPLGSIILPLQP